MKAATTIRVTCYTNNNNLTLDSLRDWLDEVKAAGIPGDSPLLMANGSGSYHPCNGMYFEHDAIDAEARRHVTPLRKSS